MKSHCLSTYTRIALVAAVAGVMTACASAPHYYDPDPYYSPRAVYYDYWYYPAIGGYYDPRARIYIYYEHNHWIRARALPTHVRPYLGHHVTVRSPHERPYEENPRHREHYLPERYRKPDPAHRGDHAWIGAPRQPSPQRDHDNRRTESGDRDRNGKDRGHKPERGAVPVPPQYREPDVKYPRQAPDTRLKDDRAIVNRLPVRHRSGGRTGGVNRKSEKKNRASNTAAATHGETTSARKTITDRVRALDNLGNTGHLIHAGSFLKTPPQAAPGHREPPAKREDKGHQQEIRKEDTRDRYRDGDDRRGNGYNDDDATSQKRQHSPYDQYEQYR